MAKFYRARLQRETANNYRTDGAHARKRRNGVSRVREGLGRIKGGYWSWPPWGEGGEAGGGGRSEQEN